MTTETDRRPGGITLVVVLAYIAFLFNILAGIFVMIDADAVHQQLRSGMTEDQLMAAGIAMIVIGVIGILLTGALARGSRVVRMLFALWIGLQIAGGLYGLVAHDGVQRGAGIVPLIFGIIILYLLFNRSAHEFFEGD
ncbi:MAG: hypothetical protein WDA60_14445 [Acidimicrobiia bacterium]|jgi:hypothetical protein